MAEFKIAFPLIAEHEGGYADVSGDLGGETYRGITRKNFPNWGGWSIVDANKPLHWNQVVEDTALEQLVEDFYQENFWDKASLSELISQKVANFTFDWYVNSGVWALKYLQTASGVTADGIVGPHTIEVVNAANEDSLLATLIDDRIAFYKGIVARDPGQEKFLNNWISRTQSFA